MPYAENKRIKAGIAADPDIALDARSHGRSSIK
jgi:hypothetical protein